MVDESRDISVHEKLSVVVRRDARSSELLRKVPNYDYFFRSLSELPNLEVFPNFSES